MKEDYHFDLVLLDLLMPEKDGQQVLETMMADERLSKIPVIVMCAQDDKEIISQCLATGAKDFIVKPLRVQECRGLEQHIGEPKESAAEKELSQYQFVKVLGRGAAGEVNLVKSKENGKLYAMKHIPLQNLSAKERRMAESEVQFLKVLVGPTLIKSYQSFVQQDSIYILMEYASGGNLADKI